jgi:SAM-dependent methyltransferase
MLGQPSPDFPSAETQPYALLPPEWQEYFLSLLSPRARFGAPRAFLRKDIAATMRRLVPAEGSVLEVGIGSGHVLAALENAVRVGVDILPEAVAAARAIDATMDVRVADALTMPVGQHYDSIICDRLIHTTPDVQRLLQMLTQHLSDDGRIFITCFNLYWGAPFNVAAQLRLHERSPPTNWFSESTLETLFTLVGLEVVHFTDRILLPADVPVLNTFLPQFPPFRYGSLYRTYTLRRRFVKRNPAPAVTVVIPARNEAGNIADAVRRMPVMGSSTEVLFVEGGSSDNTWDTIDRTVRAYRGPLRLKAMHQTGRGKADAVRVGFEQASGDLLLILDADLTVTPEDLPKFFDVMTSGLADYVQGTRLVYPMEDEAMRFLNKIGNTFFAKTFSFLLDQAVTDTLCGTKVIWKRDYERLARNRVYFGNFDPFGDFDLIFGARKLNLKILEIPIRYRNRVYGETNISRFRDGLTLLRMSAFAARKIKFA